MDAIQKVLGVEQPQPQQQHNHPHHHHTKEKSGIDVVLGSQWGDEGKGKLVDILSQASRYIRISRVIMEKRRAGERERTCAYYIITMTFSFHALTQISIIFFSFSSSSFIVLPFLSLSLYLSPMINCTHTTIYRNTTSAHV